MANILYKGPIGKEDIAWGSGTYTRRASLGTVTMTKVPNPRPTIEDHGSSFTTMLADLGSSDSHDVYVNAPVSVTADTTITSNIHLIVEKEGLITIATGVTLTINGPFSAGDYQVFSCAGTGKVVFSYAPDIYVGWWGYTAAGLTSAILSGINRNLHFRAGTHTFSSVISQTCTGDITWIADGPVTLQYTGTEAGPFITVELAGYDIKINGRFNFDANNLSRTALDIRNITAADMSSASNAELYDTYGINAYNTTVAGYGTRGISFYGGFDLIRLIKCGAKNISRAVGTGVAGSQGSSGIFSTPYATNSLWIRNVVMEDVDIDTVTSLEENASADNYDHDGINIQGPNLVDGIEQESTLTVRGGRFRNCRGRAIKSQTEYNFVDNVTVIRDASADLGSINAVEFDFQRGTGSLTNFTVIYNPLTGGTTPFAASHAVVGSYISAATVLDGSLFINNGTIINNVPVATANLPYFLVWSSAAAAFFNNISMKGITFLGQGRLRRLAASQFSKVRRFTIEDIYIPSLGAALLYGDSSDPSGCRISISSVYNAGAAAYLWEDAATSYLPIISGHNNYGFNDDLSSLFVGTYGHPALRTNRIVAEDSLIGGSITVEALSLEDDASGAFSKRGYNNGKALYIISTNYDRTSQAIFSHDGTGLLLTAGSTNIEMGNAADPGVDNQLNVWKDGTTNCINVTNKLGAAIVVTLVAIG